MSNTQKITNSLLVQQCQNGHKKSYVFLVKKWHKVFCNTAYFYVKDAAMAKDIAQDSWVIIMNKIATLKHPSAFSSWALQIVKRQALDTIKREKKYNKRQLKQEDVATQEESGLNNNHLTLHTTIKKLPYKQQLILQLFYMENKSIKQIANQLQKPVGTIKSRLFTAREQLKQTLKLIYDEK